MFCPILTLFCFIYRWFVVLLSCCLVVLLIGYNTGGFYKQLNQQTTKPQDDKITK